MELIVVHGGALTTVQDLGRPGHRAAGVPLGGAADPFALRVANLLVGNPEGSAALEFTQVGPDLTFSEDAWVVLCGAASPAHPPWSPWTVRAGDTVHFGELIQGCRAVLAVEGGIQVEPVLSSASTYLRGGIGGHHGRALRAGDRLRAGPLPARRTSGRFHVSPSVLPAYASAAVVRVLPGAQAEDFGPALHDATFQVSPRSDRMGIRLSGPPLERSQAGDLPSSAVVPGTVQVPPDGQPIVLLADAQTIGGYPQAAQVISVDIPVLAQLRPGDTLQFRPIGLADAQRLLVERERDLATLRLGLDARVSA